jgi:hypothetical protein
VDCQCGTKLFAFGSSNGKCITLSFDRSIGRGCGFDDQAVLIAFRFDEGMFFELLALILLWAHAAFCLFTARSSVDGMSRKSGLDHWVLCNKHVFTHL